MMNDLISRQAAIDVADAVWSVTGDKNVAKVWDQIKDLPSAQTERIPCKDCKYSQGDVFDRGLFCKHGATWFDVEDNHSCSWAERRTNIYG